jgi:stage V sporulation protein AC
MLAFATKSRLKVTPQEYEEMNKASQPKANIPLNCVKAFLVGGGICLVAQCLINIFRITGIELEEAYPLGTIGMIFVGSLLTGLGVYDVIVHYGGAGGILPVTGFANAMVSPAMEYKKEGFVMGVGSQMFTIAGPVLTSGIIAAFLMGTLSLLFQ